MINRHERPTVSPLSDPVVWLAEKMRPLFRIGLVRRTRRNHALEHATLHILAETTAAAAAGRSDHDGFILIGDLPTDRVERAAEEALRRLRSGQRSLAIHPNCGTNLLTSGFMATLAALLGQRLVRYVRWWDRLPLMVMLVIAALILSQPLGTALQREITTDGDPGEMRIREVRRRDLRIFGAVVTIHTVRTESA